jgi:hypothetical protein
MRNGRALYPRSIPDSLKSVALYNDDGTAKHTCNIHVLCELSTRLNDVSEFEKGYKQKKMTHC